MGRKRFYLLIGVLLPLLSSVAQAEILDLTTSNSSGYISDGFFSQYRVENTGTGNFQPFLRLSDNTPVISGYNSARGTGDDNADASPRWTHLLRWNDLAATTIGQANYLEFALDINQSDKSPLLSLNALEIWMSASPTVGLHSNWGDDPSMIRVYDLDQTADWAIYLNGSLQQGSGYGDMLAYIPQDRFIEAWNNAYAEANPYIYVYSSFGESDGNYGNNAGFEEWAVDESRPSPDPVSGTPEPSSLAFLPMVLAGLAIWRRKRN